jgi:16S rRNA C967 or C1407 C5-methylase (RsmB/RsmF family)
MFRKYDYAVEEWSEDRVLACAERQNEILALAATAVKGGGYLLYSTCTFSLEENEMVIDRFLTENEAFTVVPVLQELRAATADGIPFPGCRYPEALVLARRFYPHLSPGEGQFICLLRRADEGTEESISYRDTSEKLSKQELESVESFLKSVLRPVPAALSRVLT